MFFAILCMISALSLYSTAIWAERLSHKLSRWMIVVFIAAFTCDLMGTSLMTLMTHHAGHHHISVHLMCGLTALVIMCLHLLWALFTIWKKGRAEKLFHSFSLYAWVIWLAAFITGIPK